MLNVFRLFSRMGGQRVATRSSGEVPLDDILKSGVRGAPDVAAIASLEPRKLSVMAWHYHDDDVTGPDAAVELSATGLPTSLKSARLTHYRIDGQHSNSYAEWKRMNSPIAPNDTQYARLLESGKLATLGPPESVQVAQGAAKLRFNLPRQAVSLLVLEWDEPAR